jgi:beta-glucosidase
MNIAKKIMVILLMAITLTACKKDPVIVLTPMEERLASMTLDEKLGQMIQAERNGLGLNKITNLNLGSVLSGGGSHPAPNTPERWKTMIAEMQSAALRSTSGIPVVYGIDAVHGNNNLLGAVLFPQNIGLGATNDPELINRIGQAVAVQLKATSIAWDFAPCLAVVQDVRWGRTYESFSEDPLIVSTLGAAFINGLQSKGIMATAKHYLADGGTLFDDSKSSYMLDQGDAELTEALIREIHLQPYISAIDDSKVMSVMVSFSSINGDKMHASKYWITEVLKTELGFEGFVVSDWEAIHQLPGSLYNQVTAAINAGVDMLMEPYQYVEVLTAMKRAVNNNDIPLERVDDAVMRILLAKEALGLFEDNTDNTVLDQAGDQALAREAVQKSQVLLKNNGVLPLKKNANILLIGPGADNAALQNGGWSFSWQGESDNTNFPNATTLLDAFTEVASANGGHIYTDPIDASKADVIVVVLAEKAYAEGVGDTADLSLTGALAHAGNAEALAMARATKKPVVTLLLSGRPLLVGDEIGYWDAFVASWLFGTEAQGVTDVLYGDVDFTGKLPFTWPNTIEANLTSSMLPDRDMSLVQFDIGYGLTISK